MNCSAQAQDSEARDGMGRNEEHIHVRDSRTLGETLHLCYLWQARPSQNVVPVAVIAEAPPYPGVGHTQPMKAVCIALLLVSFVL